MLRALAHPTRVRVLYALERGRVASPSELADELGLGLPDVAYHVRVLRAANCIELVEERALGGRPVAKFYRRSAAPWFSSDDWAQLPAATRETMSANILRMIASDTYDSLLAGRFDARSDRHLSRSPLTLDDEGFAELADATDALLAEAHEIEGRALRRIADGAAGFGALLDLLLYERAD